MANEKKHIAHVKSGQTVTNNGVTEPKLPTAEDIILGELAVNYATGYERISLKNAAGNIVAFVPKAYVDLKAGDAAAVKEVQVGNTTPSDSTVEVFVDTSVDPLSVEVYNKTQINAKVEALENTDNNLGDKLDEMVVIGTTGTTNNTDLFVDTSVNPGIEVYTKAQVDSIINKLKEDNHLI
jgi:hypothetical protein